jgi:DNA-binding XRE family transcriptional regulator
MNDRHRFILPVLVPGNRVEDVTSKAAKRLGKIKRIKPCACGCGELTKATWVVGHHNPIIAEKIRKRKAAIASLPFTGTHLKTAREEAGYTRDLLGKKMNLSPRMIRDWENDARAMSPDLVPRFLEFFPELRNAKLRDSG